MKKNNEKEMKIIPINSHEMTLYYGILAGSVKPFMFIDEHTENETYISLSFYNRHTPEFMLLNHEKI